MSIRIGNLIDNNTKFKRLDCPRKLLVPQHTLFVGGEVRYEVLCAFRVQSLEKLVQ